MFNFLPESQTPNRTPTQCRHDRVIVPDPIASIYGIGLFLFCITALILSLI